MKVEELYRELANGDYPARFKRIQKFVFEWEIVSKHGVILVENDSADPGGRTFCGLDERSHPKLKFDRLTPRDVCEEYLRGYWIKNECEKLTEPLSSYFYNACVNCGAGRAKKLMTLSKGDAENFLEEQGEFYKGLVQQKPKLRIFLRGWLNRLFELRVLIT